MLASAREDYVLEVLDPALLPYDRYSPSRKVYLAFGLFAGGFLGVALVCTFVLWRNFHKALKNHALYPNKHLIVEVSS